MAPNDTLEFKTAKYVVGVSQAENQRRITSLDKVKKRLGLALFVKLCSFTLKALDEHVSKAEQKQLGLVAEERTGPRHLTVSIRPPRPTATPEAA